MTRQSNRRTFLRLGATGIGAAGLWALGALPDATRAAPAPASSPLPTREEGSFISAARGGKNTKWIIARPPGQTGPLRTVIALHGLDSDAAGVMSLGVEDALAKLPATGKPSIAVVSVDGGNNYWRPRASGEDSGAMVLNELIPMLAAKGLDTSQVAFMGWSMGGYGAMRLGSRLGPTRTFAISAISPALYLTYWGAPRDAFDSLDDFRKNSTVNTADLTSIPLRVDCGTGDGFYVATREFVNQLPRQPAGGFYAGGHDAEFWRQQLPGELAWLAS
ncbi:MAG: alpha/beta hydrolase-fold protein [Mycobacterium sp.]|uniref:alpha/beta hydrolase n=1 Tax=Mycobacterium sp. TaxID=1785 RepID=UPI003C5A92C3